MKSLKYMLLLALMFACFCTISNRVFAEDSSFDLEEMLEEDEESFVKNIKISSSVKETGKRPIKCFDVNENGMIAIGCADYIEKTVSIYTSNGDFQYGYKFESYGDFGVEFKGDFLMICFVREDIAVEVDFNGTIRSVSKIKNTKENNSHWNNTVRATKRYVGETEYILQNDSRVLDLFSSSYSKLIVKDSHGERIVYDAGSLQFVSFIVKIIVFLLLPMSVVFLVVLKRNRDSKSIDS